MSYAFPVHSAANTKNRKGNWDDIPALLAVSSSSKKMVQSIQGLGFSSGKWGC
jgi:hypothetical protein